MTQSPISFPEGSPFHSGIALSVANYAALSPIGFLSKAAAVHGERTAIIHGTLRQTWRETDKRCRRFASALRRWGIQHGDTVAIIAPNTPPMFEAHFAVPMAGAVLNTLNTRLDPEAIAFQLQHGEAKLLLVDREYSASVRRALAMCDRKPDVIDLEDMVYDGPGEPIGTMAYEAFLVGGDDGFAGLQPKNEWDPIALSYTSGTTGDPKGVVTSHRGAYLNALSQIVTWSMPPHSVYLWTLPMFHCNGWCFPWATAAIAAVNVCLRKVEPQVVLDLIKNHGVSHMCGAPIVYSMILSEITKSKRRLELRLNGLVAGAAPPTMMIEESERAGIDITHVYGLTEVYGPAAICVKQSEWECLPAKRRAQLNSRQGVASLLQDAMIVLDPDSLEPVPADGTSVGEIMFRGNITMSGYLKNPEATEAAFSGGWFHTGDLAVVEADGYVRITDRSKDVIISGGENISSIEVEDILQRYPGVSLAAVVAKADERWGEVPCAFVELQEGAVVTAEDLRKFCRKHLAGYKIPKVFQFGPIPRMATGKIPKIALREIARTKL
ncbi:acyl-CoA synthetase [soil metagenome]